MNGGYKHTINHAYDALGKLVTELQKATTEDQRVVVMEKTLRKANHCLSERLFFICYNYHSLNLDGPTPG